MCQDFDPLNTHKSAIVAATMFAGFTSAIWGSFC